MDASCWTQWKHVSSNLDFDNADKNPTGNPHTKVLETAFFGEMVFFSPAENRGFAKNVESVDFAFYPQKQGVLKKMTNMAGVNHAKAPLPKAPFWHPRL